jgi:ankyrin repeat protein
MTTPTAIFDAIRAGDAGEVRRLLAADPSLAGARDENNRSAVLLARYSHRTDALAALLDAGPPLDIFEAAAVGDMDRVRDLLDTDPEEANAFAGDGFTPLAFAAFFGHVETVRLLLERGADVHATSRNAMRLQALHAAVADKPEPIVVALTTMLLAAGADPDARQHGGFTPLHAAAQNGHERVADLLLSQGAARDAVTEDGRSPVQLAEQHGHAALAEHLATRPQ